MGGRGRGVILSTGSPDGGTAEGMTTGPLSSTDKKDKVTIGKVGFCGQPYGEGGRRRRELVWRGLILG